MLPLNHPNRIQIAFDDHRLVANAGVPDRRQLVLPRVASNQMLPNFGRARSPGGSNHETRDTLDTVVGKTRRNAEPDLGIHPSGVLRLVDTKCRSPNIRYVMRSRPLEWRSAAKLETSSRSASFSRQPEGIPSIP